MSIKDKYTVRSIDPKLTHEWLLYKHYAKRLCMIKYAFGLYSNELVGVLTIGVPAIPSMNNGKFFTDIKIETYELNRLIINDGLENNILSYFVSSVLKLVPKPVLLVSYADPNNGHHGYIYQATNWYYTGVSSKVNEWYDTKTNESIHNRHILEHYNVKKLIDIPDHVLRIKHEPKHRYFYILANKTIKKKILSSLKVDILPYPKGDNKKYDTSYKPTNQGILF